jgi:hypothetical protein
MSETDRAGDYRKELAESSRASTDAFDKAVATIAGGALALSITFIHDIAPSPVHKGWIGIAWGAFAVALVGSTASFLTSDVAHRRAITKLDEGKPWKQGGWGWTTIALNWTCAGAILAGAGALAIFAYLNLE